MKYISLFESLTGAKVKDCMADNNILFVIQKGDMGLALGRGGRNLKRAESLLKKPLKIVEFDEDVAQFIRNLVYPLGVLSVENKDKKIYVKGKDTKTKGYLIGRDRTNVRRMLNIVKRYFDIDDIIVV